jgi:hypothetical protein
MKKRMTEISTGKGNVLDRLTGKTSKFGNEKSNPLMVYSKNTGVSADKTVEGADQVPVKKKMMANLKDLDNIPSNLKKAESNLIIEKHSSDLRDDSLDEDDGYASYLYKITESKNLKKLYFKLCFKDLYCYILSSLQKSV